MCAYNSTRAHFYSEALDIHGVLFVCVCVCTVNLKVVVLISLWQATRPLNFGAHDARAKKKQTN